MRDVIVGDRLDQYELTDLLARSGMASIFKAVDLESGGTVAVKVPHAQFESDVAFFQRFEREEKIGQKLQHDNIVRFFTPLKKSRMYLVMELAEGESLRAVIGRRKKLPVDEAVGVVRQVLGALVYLHGQGIVHRDLKPENVLIGNDGRVKLLDFGIAMDESARRLTWVGLTSSIGTPDYMAPEQVRGRRGDVRTDVYSVGTMLYEMITGELPLTASNVHAMMRAKLEQDPRPPRELVPELDPKIEEIILRAIERSPKDRYRTAAEMLADLEDPSKVELRDRSERRDSPAALLLRRVPRSVVSGIVLVAVFAALGALIWATGRKRPRPDFPSTDRSPVGAPRGH